MNIAIRLIVLTTIIVGVIDSIAFYRIKNNPEILTVLSVILVILITVVALSINIWFHILR